MEDEEQEANGSAKVAPPKRDRQIDPAQPGGDVVADRLRKGQKDLQPDRGRGGYLTR